MVGDTETVLTFAGNTLMLTCDLSRKSCRGIRQGSLLLPDLSQIHGEIEDFAFLIGKSSTF